MLSPSLSQIGLITFFQSFFSSSFPFDLYEVTRIGPACKCYVTARSKCMATLSVAPVLHCCVEEDPSRPSISFLWDVLCVVDFLSLILVGHSTGKTHETMKRTQVHHTLTSNDFHAALFVDEYPRPSIDVCTIGNRPILHTNLAQPPLSVQL